MKTPNIFDYATSELSQDAFLCWLIACADCDDVSLKNLGLNFILFLYNSTTEEGHHIEQNAVQGLIKNKDYPWRQYKKTDVYFQANVSEKITSFIIEDKTDTQMHGDQLGNYAAEVEGDEIKEDDIRKIYLKTGYIYSDERKYATDNGYGVVDLAMFLEFLACHNNSVKSDIFKSYFDYIEKIKKQRDDLLIEAKNFHGDYDGYINLFRHSYVQWEFMLELQRSIRGVLLKEKHLIGSFEDDNMLGRGKNVGGGPWTQCWWHHVQGKYQNEYICENLFWRVDPWYSLRLRHGVWPEKGQEYDGFHHDRKERLDIYRKIFEEEGNKIFKSALRLPSGRTGYESTIGEIQFNCPEYSVQNVLKLLPDFQRNFIRHASSKQLLIK